METWSEDLTANDSATYQNIDWAPMRTEKLVGGEDGGVEDIGTEFKNKIIQS